MEGPPLGPGGEDITWPDQVAPRGRKASSTRKIKPQTSNLKVYGDVLSGKPCQNPLVRGTFGEVTKPPKQGHQPRCHRAFQMKGEREQEMNKILKEFIERGWIEPCSSEWGSPCVVVPEKVAGKWRLVVDYCDLKSESKHDAYSLPLIVNLLQKQQGKLIFSILDQKHGYQEMSLAKSSQDTTAMSTPLGLMR